VNPKNGIRQVKNPEQFEKDAFIDFHEQVKRKVYRYLAINVCNF
jgi:hypothetical protein